MASPVARQKPPFIIAGGGLVGLCCAINLRWAGHDVVLVDPGDMKRAASYGNNGQFAVGDIVPLAVPGIVRKVPGYLLDPLGPLAIRWRDLPRLTPWLLRFTAESRRERMEAVSAGLAALCNLIHFDYEPMLRAAAAEHLLDHTECIKLFETREQFDLEERKYGYLRERAGAQYELLDDKALHALEPEISPKFRFGAIMKGRKFIRNLAKLIDAFGALLRREGGTVVAGEVADFERADGKVVAVKLSDGRRIAAEGIVVAAGAWSKRLCAILGDKVPLECERGYHVMLPRGGIKLGRSLTIPSRGFGIVPMEEGIRLAGTVELARLGSPPNFERADRLIANARVILPNLKYDGAERWMGNRPSLPDSLPVIDRARRVSNVYYAFGHGHRGMSFAPTTGKLVAGLVAGRPSNFDMRPYRLDRL